MTALDCSDWAHPEAWPWTRHALKRLQERCSTAEPGDLVVTGSTRYAWRRSDCGRIDQHAYIPVHDPAMGGEW